MQTTMKSAKRVLSMLLIFALVVGTAFTGIGSFMHIADEAYAAVPSVTANITLVGSENWTGWNGGKHPVIAQKLEINKFNIAPFITGSTAGFTEPDGIKTAHALIEAVYYSIYGIDADAAGLNVTADSDTAMAVKEKLNISWEAPYLSQKSVYGNSLYQASYVDNVAGTGIGSDPVTEGSNIAFAEYAVNGGQWAPTYNYFDVLEVEPEIQTSELGTSSNIKLKLRQNLAGWSGPSLVEGSIIKKFLDNTADVNYPFGDNPWPYGTTDVNGITSVVVMDLDTVGNHSFILGGDKPGNKLAYLRCSYYYDGTTISALNISEDIYTANNTSLATYTINGIDVRETQANGLDYSLVSTANTITVNVALNDANAVVENQKIYVDGVESTATFPNTTGGSVDVPLGNGGKVVSFTVANGNDKEIYALNVIKLSSASDNAPIVTRVINGIADYSGYTEASFDDDWILAKLAAGKIPTAAEKTGFLKNTLNKASGMSAGRAAKYAIALSALNIDATRVPAGTDGAEINLVEKAFVDANSLDIYSLYYVLNLANLNIYESTNPNCTKAQLVQRAIDTYAGSYGWGKDNDFGTDTSARMIVALLPYYNAAGTGIDGVSAAQCNTIKSYVDADIAYYSTVQDEASGAILASYGSNSDSTAVVISALSAYGRNPNEVKKNGKSLIDGLLQYESADHRLGSTDKTYSSYSSWEGLEALGNYKDMLAGKDGNNYAFTASVAPYTAWPNANLLTNISITVPTKTTYNVGENFSLDGLSVKAIFNGDTATATDVASGDGTTGYTVSLADGTQLNAAGVTRVNVTYRGYTQSFNIIVNADASTPYQANKVNVKVQSTSGVIAQESNLVIADDATALDVLKTVLNNAGKTCVLEKGGTYVASIDGLGEMDKGPNSGWMYNVNNVTPQIPASDYELDNGDTVLWYYTLDYTKDSRNTGMKSGEDTTTEKTATTNVETTATVTDGKATASVSASDVAKAIEKVNEQVKTDTTGKTTEKEVVLEVKSTGNVDAVETTIPANSVNELAKADANVVVKTECGDIEIPADSMDNIATQAAGQELSITMENKKASEVVAAVGADKIKEETGLEGKALENVSIVEVTIKAGEKTVTSFGGKKISLSLPAENGQAAGKNYKVLAISADGTMELMTGVCVVENGKKVVKVTSTHLTTFVVTGEEVNNPFKDVSASDYFFDPVLWAVEKNVTSGKSADTFAPFDGCTRAQMVTFLWRAAGSPWASANWHFSDVPEDAYYADAVEWAIAAGIAKGTSENTFAPNGSVTREQLAAFIYRYAQSKGEGFTGSWMFLLDYDDASQVSEWADEAMHWCVMNNIVTGTTAKTLSPAGEANRAQIVTMLYRYFNL
jgi:hypothetical protein